MAATFPYIGVNVSLAFSQGLPRADSPDQEREMMDLASEKQGLYGVLAFLAYDCRLLMMFVDFSRFLIGKLVDDEL